MNLFFFELDWIVTEAFEKSRGLKLTGVEDLKRKLKVQISRYRLIAKLYVASGELQVGNK